MHVLIWLRRGIVFLFLITLLLAILSVYILVDGLIRAAIVGGLGGVAQVCLWLDRSLTWKLRKQIFFQLMASRLESDEPSPIQQNVD